MATLPFNLAVMSIPAYYILALAPHSYETALAVRSMPFNTANPRGSSNSETLKRSLTERDFAAYERAEACHNNSMENMPLFVAAIFAGLLAEQKVGQGGVGLNQFVVGWMVIRVLYTINYIVVETKQWSRVRSALYTAGSIWAFVLLGRAAFALGGYVLALMDLLAWLAELVKVASERLIKVENAVLLPFAGSMDGPVAPRRQSATPDAFQFAPTDVGSTPSTSDQAEQTPPRHRHAVDLRTGPTRTE